MLWNEAAEDFQFGFFRRCLDFSRPSVSIFVFAAQDAGGVRQRIDINAHLSRKSAADYCLLFVCIIKNLFFFITTNNN